MGFGANFEKSVLKKGLAKNYLFVLIPSRNIYMLFTGQEVRMGKNCARGLEYGPRAVLKTKGTVFSHTDRPSLVNNIFIFFLQYIGFTEY